MATTSKLHEPRDLKEMAVSALKKTSDRIMANAPNEGRLSDAAVAVASKVERASDTLRNSDMSFQGLGSSLRSLPWGPIAAGVSVVAGGIYLSRHPKVVQGLMTKIEDLIDERFGEEKKAAPVAKAKPKKRGTTARKTTARKTTAR